MKNLLSRFRFPSLTRLCLSLALLLVAVAVVSSFGDVIQTVSAGNPTGAAAGAGTTAGTGVTSTNTGGVFADIGQTLGNVLATVSTLLVKLVSLIIYIALYWMGDLMDNTFILEGEMGLKLQTVWVIVRNFVNIFFALALVVVAAMSVVGYGDDSGNYALKKFIPKMALALIAVNFTFLACRIVLDVNNVLTTAIFSIPQSITTTSDIAVTQRQTKIFRNMRCFNPNETIAEARARVRLIEQDNRFKDVITNLAGVCFVQGTAQTLNPDVDVHTFDSSSFNRKDFTWAMASQFNGLHQLNQTTQITNASFSDLTINAIFSLVLAIVFGTAYIAMFIILIGRVAVLWMTIILSPLAVISLVIPEFLPQELDITKRFLDNAFIPLKMSIPLSFGYILVSQMAVTIDTGSSITADKVIDLSEGGELARNVTMQSIIYGAASVAVIWMGVFMSVTENIVGSGLVNTFKGTMENIGKTVAKWPTYLPFIPVSGGVASLQGVRYGLQEAQSQIAESIRRRDEKAVDRTLQRLGLAPGAIRTAINNIERMVDQGNINSGQLTQELRTLVNHDRQNNTTYFQNNAQRLARETDPNKQAEIAASFGYSRDAAGWTQFTQAVQNGDYETLQNNVAQSNRQNTPQTANYAGIASGALQGNNTSMQFSNENIIPEDVRRELQMNGATLDPKQNRVNFALLMQNLNNPAKISDTAIGEMIDNGYLQGLANSNPNVAEQWSRDSSFQNRLTAAGGDAARNKKIRAVFQSMLFPGVSSLSTTQQQQISERSRLDEDGNTYTASS